jgi:hypothetical protein
MANVGRGSIVQESLGHQIAHATTTQACGQFAIRAEWLWSLLLVVANGSIGHPQDQAQTLLQCILKGGSRGDNIGVGRYIGKDTPSQKRRRHFFQECVVQVSSRLFDFVRAEPFEPNGIWGMPTKLVTTPASSNWTSKRIRIPMPAQRKPTMVA